MDIILFPKITQRVILYQSKRTLNLLTAQEKKDLESELMVSCNKEPLQPLTIQLDFLIHQLRSIKKDTEQLFERCSNFSDINEICISSPELIGQPDDLIDYDKAPTYYSLRAEAIITIDFEINDLISSLIKAKETLAFRQSLQADNNHIPTSLTSTRKGSFKPLSWKVNSLASSNELLRLLIEHNLVAKPSEEAMGLFVKSFGKSLPSKSPAIRYLVTTKNNKGINKKNLILLFCQLSDIAKLTAFSNVQLKNWLQFVFRDKNGHSFVISHSNITHATKKPKNVNSKRSEYNWPKQKVNLIIQKFLESN